MKDSRIFRNRLKKEEGFSLIALVVTLLLLGSIGYIVSSLITRSQESIPRTMDSAKAFHIAEGGVQYVGKYLKVSGGTDWTTAPVPPNQPISLGSGNFTVTFSPVDADNLNATITGNFGSARKQSTVAFQKTSGTALAVRSRGAIYIGSGAWVDCEPLNPSNPLCTNANIGSCPCTRQNVSSADMPAFTIPSPSPPLPPGGCTMNSSRTIPAGNYYCPSGLTVGNNVVVTISGAVTFFTTTFSLNNNARFNQSGAAPNVLVMAQGDVSVYNNARFKGAIYAPGYDIGISNNAVYTGTIAGGDPSNPYTVSISNNADFDVSAGSNSAYYNQAGGGVGSLVSITRWQE